jgi:hypothetical protein
VYTGDEISIVDFSYLDLLSFWPLSARFWALTRWVGTAYGSAGAGMGLAVVVCLFHGFTDGDQEPMA